MLAFCSNAQTGIIDGHEYVDLGLPSGTLWATCNVGANAPEEYGDYFAWGETVPKDDYEWNTYKWCNGNKNNLTKYCNSSLYGTADNKMELDPSDDAAYVNWGPSWRMPTFDQLREMKKNCTWTCTTQNGVNGLQVTGPNGSTIFLPAAGFFLDENKSKSVVLDGKDGCYWSRNVVRHEPDCATYLDFVVSGGGIVRWLSDRDRSCGFTVRAVHVP